MIFSQHWQQCECATLTKRSQSSTTLLGPLDTRPPSNTAANDRVFHAIGLGSFKVDVPNGSSSARITLKDSLCT
jgi:hypothetical protein